ncbi:MAG: hypothetical protein SFV19_01040 [Rhodospirillaceae bacterium]|nr:hypothetical protein [Rhodospirillaceae bacterium]
MTCDILPFPTRDGRRPAEPGHYRNAISALATVRDLAASLEGLLAEGPHFTQASSIRESVRNLERIVVDMVAQNRYDPAEFNRVLLAATRLLTDICLGVSQLCRAEGEARLSS